MKLYEQYLKEGFFSKLKIRNKCNKITSDMFSLDEFDPSRIPKEVAIMAQLGWYACRYNCYQKMKDEKASKKMKEKIENSIKRYYRSPSSKDKKIINYLLSLDWDC